MPELPEVETVRRTLSPLIGLTVTKVWGSGMALHMQRPVDIAAVRRSMTDGAVEAIRRWGKYLFIDLIGRPERLVVHLGMTGRLRLAAVDTARPKHTHLVLSLSRRSRSRDTELRFTDPRRFGQVFVVTAGRERAHPNLARLGEDPLTGDVSGRFLYDRSRGRKGQLKTFLLDQSVIAGVGNIYASEALWQAGIRPTLAPGKLSKPRAAVLADAVNGILRAALRDGGTSLRDFVAADGKTGEHADYLKVYGREGQSCPRTTCEGRIRRTVVGGRATFSCPRCQSR